MVTKIAVIEKVRSEYVGEGPKRSKRKINEARCDTRLVEFCVGRFAYGVGMVD